MARLPAPPRKMTQTLPMPLDLQSAALRFPANKAAPIAADLSYRHGGAPVDVSFDFDQRGPQSWDISFETNGGTLELGAGAATLAIDGRPVLLDGESEYPRLYRRFAELVDRGECECDLAPFRLVADIFLLARRTTTAAFED